MAGVAGKGEHKIIMVGDNRYGMPEEYDSARKQKTLEYYRKGDSASKETIPVFNATASDVSNHPQRKMNYGVKTLKVNK